MCYGDERVIGERVISRLKTVEVLPDLPEESRLTGLCRRWKDFGPHSDVGVLVSFEDDAQWSLFDLVRMEQESEALLGRSVDLASREAVQQSDNYIRRRSTLDSAEVVYEEG